MSRQVPAPPQDKKKRPPPPTQSPMASAAPVVVKNSQRALLMQPSGKTEKKDFNKFFSVQGKAKCNVCSLAL